MEHNLSKLACRSSREFSGPVTSAEVRTHSLPVMNTNVRCAVSEGEGWGIGRTARRCSERVCGRAHRREFGNDAAEMCIESGLGVVWG